MCKKISRVSAGELSRMADAEVRGSYYYDSIESGRHVRLDAINQLMKDIPQLALLGSKQASCTN